MLDVISTKDILMEVFHDGGAVQIETALLGIQQTSGLDAKNLIESVARGKDLYADFIICEAAESGGAPLKWKVLLFDTSTLEDRNINQLILEKNYGHVNQKDWHAVQIGLFNNS